jgi:phosphatidylglycerophosphatase A
MKKKIAFMLSTLFYAGSFPKAPGTFGSFVSLFLIAPITYYFGFTGLMVLILISFILAMFSVTETLKYTKHDPSFIVIDELIGQAVTFIFVSNFLANNNNLSVYLFGFIFFRLFDVLKPFPVSYADKKIRNAFGVIFDDVLAGVYASICLLVTKMIVF